VWDQEKAVHSVARPVLGALAALALVCAACQPEQREADAEWAAARALWNIERDPSAWRAWRAVDPSTHEGREARRLLREAEPIYRRGIEEVRSNDGDAR